MNRDFSLVRWLTFAALLASAGIFLLPAIQRGDAIVLPMLALSVIAALLFTLALELWLRLVLKGVGAPAPRLEALNIQKAFELNRKFLKAAHPQDILESAMSAVCDATNAVGCSFVPYDEWGQKLPALMRGDVPSSALQQWAVRLSAPGTRQECKTCQALGAGRSCVLLRDTRGAAEAVRCLVLKRAERAVGVFNLYFESPHIILDESQRTWLEQIMASTAAALQMLEWREDDITSRRAQSTAARAAQTDLLFGLLHSLRETMDVEFASFWIAGGVMNESDRASLLIGDSKSGRVSTALFPEAGFIQGLWDSIAKTRQPVHLSNVSLREKELWQTFSAFPVMWNQEPPLGLLLIASPRPFSTEQSALLQKIAGEAALILLNARFMVAVEYQAVLDERARLAREIHDGLAQTLAFLKMQSEQMQAYLAQGRLDRLTDMLAASNRTLSDAYLDARQAIDNLRRVPDLNLSELLRRTAEEFQTATNIPVNVNDIAPLKDIQLNVRAQLIRIVQEALANVRKHARAQAVSLGAREQNGELILEVCDDGVGFAPDTVALPSQYGLRGMRERAEMIGAEFQVISRPGEGTIVRLQIPLAVGEEK